MSCGEKIRLPRHTYPLRKPHPCPPKPQPCPPKPHPCPPKPHPRPRSVSTLFCPMTTPPQCSYVRYESGLMVICDNCGIERPARSEWRMEHLDCLAAGWCCSCHGWECTVPTSTPDIRRPSTAFSGVLDVEHILRLGKPLHQAATECTHVSPPPTHVIPCPSTLNHTPTLTNLLCLARIPNYLSDLAPSRSRL